VTSGQNSPQAVQKLGTSPKLRVGTKMLGTRVMVLPAICTQSSLEIGHSCVIQNKMFLQLCMSRLRVIQRVMISVTAQHDIAMTFVGLIVLYGTFMG